MNGRIVTEAVGPHGDPADVVEARDHAVAVWWLKTYLAKRPAFFEWAACRGSTLDFSSGKSTVISACLQVCGGCAVRVQCRDFADELQDGVSVLGGEDARARKARWHLEAKRAKEDAG